MWPIKIAFIWQCKLWKNWTVNGSLYSQTGSFMAAIFSCTCVLRTKSIHVIRFGSTCWKIFLKWQLLYWFRHSPNNATHIPALLFCCSAVCWYFNRPIACCCAPPIVRHKRVQFVCVSWKLTGNFNEKPIFLLRMRQNAFGSLCRRSLTERKQSGAVVLGSSSLLNFVLCNINCASPCSKDTCFVCNGVCIGFGTTNPSIVIAC